MHRCVYVYLFNVCIQSVTKKVSQALEQLSEEFWFAQQPSRLAQHLLAYILIY